MGVAQEVVGKQLNDLPTPALVIDTDVFTKNCERMARRLSALKGWEFRTHIKTHKAVEGTEIQCKTLGGKIVASTLPEVAIVTQSDLLSRGLVKDMCVFLFSMPAPIKALKHLSTHKRACEEHGAVLRLMVDNPLQVEALAAFHKQAQMTKKWSVFIKVDIETKRAGLPPRSDDMVALIKSLIEAQDQVSIYGTYTHAGSSYASRSSSEALDWLSREIKGANEAAKVLKQIAAESNFTLSDNLKIAVGATPTAHVADEDLKGFSSHIASLTGDLVGNVELHAGNFSLLDAQQLGTNLIKIEDCAMTVTASVISVYPARGEALCDAGALALSKDTGPIKGFGLVIDPPDLKGWIIGRTSQEHGILTQSEDDKPKRWPKIGEQIRVIPQHACLTAAQFPQFLTVQGDSTVRGIWTPAKFWW